MEAYLVDVCDPGRAQGMALREQAPRHVHGYPPAMGRLAAVDQGSALTFVAQTQILVVQDLRRGEAVVQLDQIEIRDVDTRGFVSQLRGRTRDLVEIGQTVLDARVNAAQRLRGANSHGAAHEPVFARERLA